jgi:hypothetical protein
VKNAKAIKPLIIKKLIGTERLSIFFFGAREPVQLLTGFQFRATAKYERKTS